MFMFMFPILVEQAHEQLEAFVERARMFSSMVDVLEDDALDLAGKGGGGGGGALHGSTRHSSTQHSSTHSSTASSHRNAKRSTGVR